MKFVMATIRPHKLDDVRAALEDLLIGGLTVSTVHGHGRQRGKAAVYRGAEYRIDLLEKLLLEIAVLDEQLEPVIDMLVKVAGIDNIGDGKIFVLPLENAYRIRTYERGYIAI